jgi:hypothetical protein
MCVLDLSADDRNLQPNDAAIVFRSVTMLPSSRLYLREPQELRRRSPAARSGPKPLAQFEQHCRGMANRSLDERVAILESSMGGKTIEQHFREHAELIDRRFAEVHSRFTAQDKRFEAIDARFGAIDARFVSIEARFGAIDAQLVAVHARFDAMDERFSRIDHEMGIMRRDLSLILKKLNA